MKPEKVHVAIVKLTQLAARIRKRLHVEAEDVEAVVAVLEQAVGGDELGGETEALRNALYSAVQILSSDDPSASSPEQREAWAALASGAFEPEGS